MNFRKKPIVIQATQWFENGDHPEDDVTTSPLTGVSTGGRVVRRYRTPDMDGEVVCKQCNQGDTDSSGLKMHEHGWIDTLEGGHIVCPGDWIITGVKGERYPCKPDIFQSTYDPSEEGADPCFCILPPKGWICSRLRGHEGPCAATEKPAPDDRKWLHFLALQLPMVVFDDVKKRVDALHQELADLRRGVRKKTKPTVVDYEGVYNAMHQKLTTSAWLPVLEGLKEGHLMEEGSGALLSAQEELSKATYALAKIHNPNTAMGVAIQEDVQLVVNCQRIVSRIKAAKNNRNT